MAHPQLPNDPTRPSTDTDPMGDAQQARSRLLTERPARSFDDPDVIATSKAAAAALHAIRTASQTAAAAEDDLVLIAAPTGQVLDVGAVLRDAQRIEKLRRIVVRASASGCNATLLRALERSDSPERFTELLDTVP